MPKMFLISSSFNGQQLYLNHICRKSKTIEQLFLWKWTFSTNSFSINAVDFREMLSQISKEKLTGYWLRYSFLFLFLYKLCVISFESLWIKLSSHPVPTHTIFAILFTKSWSTTCQIDIVAKYSSSL